MPLVRCPDCDRHVHACESRCPFCGGDTERGQPVAEISPGRRTRAAALLLGAAIGLGTCAPTVVYGGPPPESQSGPPPAAGDEEDTSSSDGGVPPPAPVYGGPPPQH